MKFLDPILSDPRAYSAVPSAEQISAWNESILKKWTLENAAARWTPLPLTRRPPAMMLFWSSVTIGGVMLGNRIWNSLAISTESLHHLHFVFSDLTFSSLTAHPYWLALLAAGFATLLTRPLREKLLAELG